MHVPMIAYCMPAPLHRLLVCQGYVNQSHTCTSTLASYSGSPDQIPTEC